ncbi:MAG: CHAT domain-containing protein [Nitrospirae bacterium]|nr:CHAT domain-containing protein [Nitrospirota bacterium]
MNNLAVIYHTTGRYAEAEPLYKKALEITKKIYKTEEHPKVASGMNNLAELYHITSRYREAEYLYKRALEIYKQAYDYTEEQENVVIVMNNLALLYYAESRYAEAELLYKKTREMFIRVYKTEEHENVATSINNLAGLYHITSRYAEAEPLYKRALDIRKKIYKTEEHENVAQSMNNLAGLYHITSRYAEAEPLYKRALDIRKKVYKTEEHEDVASSMNNLAKLYRDTSRYAEAEPLYKRALDIRKKVYKTEEHENVATNMNNLAELYSATSRYAEAGPLYKRALEIYTKVYKTEEHPDVAISMNNLAGLYEATSRYTEAELLYKRSLEIKKKVYSTEEHPNVAISMSNLAMFYGIIDKHNESDNLFQHSLAIYSMGIEEVLPILSDRQKLNYVKKKRGNIYVYLSHTSGYMLSNQDSVTQTFNEWLKWKNIVMEAQGRYIEAAMRSDNPEVKRLFDELNMTRRTIAALNSSGPKNMTPEAYAERRQKLEKQRESLEVELSKLSKDYALEKNVGKINAKMLSGILPPGSVYLDYAQIDYYNFKEKKWDKPRYLVFVFVPDKEPIVKLLDLGEAEGTDDHIKSYIDYVNEYGEAKEKLDQDLKRLKELQTKSPEDRDYLSTRDRIEPIKREIEDLKKALSEASGELSKKAQPVYDAVLKPLQQYTKGKQHIYISPDGTLNLIPFEALKTPEGKYLIEQHDISYIGAGRDFVRFEDTTVAEGGAVVFANPDYDMGLTEKEEMVKAMNLRGTTTKGDVSRDLKGLKFPPLHDTIQEAEGIEKALKGKYNITDYQDKNALEEALLPKKAINPKILHIATHGYFLPDEKEERRPDPIRMIGDGQNIPDTKTENPMLRSGIVLAGVNKAIAEGRDDGVISAEKILGMHLKGTRLVVLSACKTGVGDVQLGEGVAGLRRSFILAGAKTVVMSLWSVPSQETTELMVDFYTLMSNGKDKSEALKQAKLNMMKKEDSPFYWGAFILLGNTE